MQRRTVFYSSCLVVALMVFSTAALAQYQLTKLVSNQIGRATHIDPLSVNAWGLVFGPGSPWWVSDNNSGWSTLYDAKGNKQTLEVEVPSANGAGIGTPTGIVWNGSSQFVVQGWASIFIFDTLDGTISGWAPQSDPNNSIIAVKKAGAMYTGLAITNHPSGNFLYAADQANNKVDVYDGNFKFVKSFTDSSLPAGFAPFGIQDINGTLYVAFADTAGGPGGFIDVFTESGTFVKTLISGSPLNQPWGIALAPSNFGPLSSTLLISNNIDVAGTINGFNPTTGAFVATMTDTHGRTIQIDQLWGIAFGGGSSNNGATNQLFYTAGPSKNLAGAFGSILFK